jgi:tetratricopeptide (TPR) repeat protein
MHQRTTIYGLGGCGKSALAIEFAYRTLAQQTGRLVFWVPAINRESFELAYREIGIRLRIPGITDDNTDIKQLVKDALDSNVSYEWLMIIDNADDPQVLVSRISTDTSVARLIDYLPNSDRGKIVFTTRSKKAAGDLTQSSKLELKDIGKAGARQLLSRRVTNYTLLCDTKAIDELLWLLAYLPLAIVQAAAFIDNNDIAISEYISLIRDAGDEVELFGEHFEDPSRYREMDSTIAKTWHISFDQIRRQDALAAEYLSFMACIDRINIPRSLLPSKRSAVQQAKAIGTLKGYAFITERQQVVPRQASDTFFDMHRLVHMAVTLWLKGHHEQEACVATAAARLEELVPHGGYENMEVWTRYLSHANHVAGLERILDDERRASLLDRVGGCQKSLGQYSAAETAYRQFFLIRQKVLGAEHPDILTNVDSLGSVLRRQGRYEAAEEMSRRALEGREKVLGKEHPDTLTSVGNLAGVLRYQGKYEAAEEMNRRALEGREKVLGKEHPHTLMSVWCLADLLKCLGRRDEAMLLYERAATGFVTALGIKHPHTLECKRQFRAAKGQVQHREN